MTETPPQLEQKPNLSEKLNQRVIALRNQAQTTWKGAMAEWKSMNPQDAVKTFVASGGLSMTGVTFTALGRAANLPPIEIMGEGFALAGGGGMILSWAKMVEIAAKEQIDSFKKPR